MLHADVEPEPHWVNKLIAQLLKYHADVVSVVVPVKNVFGLTSTAVDGYTTGGNLRRLCMREVVELPETFSAADLKTERALLVNTGCWICDFTKPWVENVCFTVQDVVAKGTDGKWRAGVVPEDWNFSRDLHSWGCRVFATRAVKVAHRGTGEWGNQTPWGLWQRDKEYFANGGV